MDKNKTQVQYKIITYKDENVTMTSKTKISSSIDKLWIT